MIVIDFLYYIVYRIFRLIPRKESIDHKLASSFCAGLFWLNLLTMLILIFKVFDLDKINLNAS